MRFGTIDSDVGAVDMLAEIHGEGFFDEDFVKWMADCPTGPNRWYVAHDGDKVVAACGLLPIIVEMYDCRHVGALCNNAEAIVGREGALPDLVKHALGDMKPDVAINVAEDPCRGVGWEKRGTLELLKGETTRAWKEIHQYDYRDFKYYPTFKQMPIHGHPRFMVVRGETFMRWRYAEPGMTYYQSVFPSSRHAIWTKHGGRKIVMETNSWETITNLGDDVGVWQFRDTKVSKYLKGMGFKVGAQRDFVIHTSLNADYDLDRFRFELCDDIGVA